MDSYTDLVSKSLKEYYPSSESPQGFGWDVMVCESLRGTLLYRVYKPWVSDGYEYGHGETVLDVGIFCDHIRLSPEDKVIWMLKFGHSLPLFYSDLQL